MSSTIVLIRHKTQPGQRDAVHAVWERHMRPAIAGNHGHQQYFYCFDDGDPDAITAFQQYADAESARAFLSTASYAAYVSEVEPLLAGPPVVTTLTPVWIKDAVRPG